MTRVRNFAHLILRLEVIDSVECPLEKSPHLKCVNVPYPKDSDLDRTEAIIDDIMVLGTTEA